MERVGKGEKGGEGEGGGQRREERGELRTCKG